MQDVVVCGFARTPFGKYKGKMKGFSAIELGTIAVKELIKKSGFEAESGIVDQVYFGQVLQGGSGQAPARQVALNAGLPNYTPCTTINKVCGSSLKAVMIGATEIKAGLAEVIIAGGMESMSNVPKYIREVEKGLELTYDQLDSLMINDGLKDAFSGEMMGNTGETIALEMGISRSVADGYALRSHTLARQAWENGWLEGEVIKLEELQSDEGIRYDCSIDSLSKLSPVFDDEGIVTAGNSSQLSDGAAAVMICSKAAAMKYDFPVYCSIVDYVTSGVEPNRVMSAPIPAIEELLTRNNLEINQIDIVEHNEAFATASCGVQKYFDLDDEKFNVNGGAVAIGHPLGATGARCLMNLIGAMIRLRKNTGIVTVCLGGGNAVAMLIRANNISQE